MSQGRKSHGLGLVTKGHIVMHTNSNLDTKNDKSYAGEKFHGLLDFIIM